MPWMKSLTAVRWIAGKAVHLASLFLFALLLLLSPAGFVRGDTSTYLGFAGSRYDPGQYWLTLKHYLGGLAAGQLLIDPPHGQLLRPDPALLISQLSVTAVLLVLGLVLSMLLGTGFGYLLSRFAPRHVRRGAWFLLTLVTALPDILMIVAFQIGIYALGLALDIHLPVYGTAAGQMTWRHYLVPLAALAILPVPSLSRIVAAALEEAGARPHVRAAHARGLAPRRILWRHVGRNAAIDVWAAMPVVLGVLISAEPIVEYMAEIPGLGRQLLRGPSGYGAVLCLLPLLMAMAGVSALADGGQRWINPVQREREPGGFSPSHSRESWWRRLCGLPGSLARTAVELGVWITGAAYGLPSLPVRAWRALRTNLVLAAGVAIILLLVGIGLFADRLAPYSWTREEPVRIEGERVTPPPYPPGHQNLLGSDPFGRDVLSRLIWGTRFTLLLAAAAVPVRFAVALPVGMGAAYRGGPLERLVRTLATLFVSLPAVLLPLALIPGLNDLYAGRPAALAVAGVLALSLPGVPRLAEAIRLQTREILSRPFIEGGRAVGAPGARLLFRHVLPHALPGLVVLAAAEVPLVLTVTAFLGLRQVYVGGAIWDPQVQRIIGPYMPEWGTMMSTPFHLLIGNRWWLWTPFAALFLAVLGFTLLGEGLRRQVSGGGSGHGQG